MRKATLYLLLFIPILLYIISLNSYLSPVTFDNVIYLEGAKSLLNDGTYTYMGKVIRDWPPVMSLSIVLFSSLGLSPIIAAKVFVLISVLIGMWFSFKVLEQESFDFPILSYFIFIISPTAFLWGTREMTEWPYMAFSMVFLFLLGKMEKNRTSFYLSIFGGLLFALCILTRYAGITLLGAVFTMIFQRALYTRKPKVDG